MVVFTNDNKIRIAASTCVIKEFIASPLVFGSYWARRKEEVKRHEAPSPPGLVYAHIFLPSGKMPSTAKVGKCSKGARHRGGSGLALVGVALPPAQAGDDPSGPRQGQGGMRVPLLFCLAFQGRPQLLEHFNFRLAKGIGGGARGQPFPRLDQLHHPDRRRRRQASHFHQVPASLHQARLDVQPLPF